MTNYGLLVKHVFAETSPRTEYSLTQNGQRLFSIISQIKLLDNEIRSAEQAAPEDAKIRATEPKN